MRRVRGYQGVAVAPRERVGGCDACAALLRKPASQEIISLRGLRKRGVDRRDACPRKQQASPRAGQADRPPTTGKWGDAMLGCGDSPCSRGA